MIRFAPFIAIIAVFAVGFATHVFAQDKHDHGDGHKDTAAHFDKQTFATVKEAWAFITAKTSESETLLAEQKLEDLHKVSEHFEGAVHTLEMKSDMVTGDSKAKLTSVLKQLDKATDELHHATEAKNAGASSLAVKKIKGLLPLIETLYPAGALK